MGTHYEALPVNAPRVQARTYHADGSMRFGAPHGTDAYYEPNSFNGPVEVAAAKEPPLRISGDADRYNHRVGNDDYSQVAALFHILWHEQQQRLYSNIAAAMQGVPQNIVDRQLEHFGRVDPAYKAGVAAAIARTHLPDQSDPVSASAAPTPAPSPAGALAAD